MTDEEFSQWFAGFVDGEGYFYIVIPKNSVVGFRFGIHLHIDDLEVLEFIKRKLNSGNIFSSTSSSTASFELNSMKDITTNFIPLFDKFPLNGVKYLDYLAFKNAIDVKNNAELSKPRKLELIRELKNSMNTKRVNFKFPSNHTVRITPYWLLGLIEGSFSFSLSKNIMQITFYLSLTAAQAPLINEIKYMLDSLLIEDRHLKLPEDCLEKLRKAVSVYKREKRVDNAKPTIAITVTQTKFIVEKFIPLLLTLNFVTKKYYDFLDWAFITYLIYTGKHTTEAGKNLIIMVSNRINNKALTTYKGKALQVIPQSLIDEVWKMKDVYTKGKDGLRVHASDQAKTVRGQHFYILAVGLNGAKLTFKNSEVCGNYFKVTSATINNRIVKSLPISNSNKDNFLLTRKPL